MYCSALRADWSSGKRFSYSVGSAKLAAALAFVLAKSSLHNLTVLEREREREVERERGGGGEERGGEEQFTACILML